MVILPVHYVLYLVPKSRRRFAGGKGSDQGRKHYGKRKNASTARKKGKA